MYYLNFGVYFLDLKPIEKPMSNLPKTSDWHLYARYESFRELPTLEQNKLFSTAEKDSISLEERCKEIGSFVQGNIIPKLESLGKPKSILSLSTMDRTSENMFEPFRSQSISKANIIEYLVNQSGF